MTRRTVLAAGALAFAPRAARAAPPSVKLRDLWGAHGDFSDLAKRLAGSTIAVDGYMAPPLKPEIDFFVLTRIPMAFCPFCDNEAAWPEDLLLVKVDDPVSAVDFNRLIRTEGILDLGTKTDQATGFVSRIRLLRSRYALA